MGIALGIGQQDLIDGDEKVVEPPIGQGPRDRPLTVAGAEGFMFDMGMSHVLVAGRRIRIPGHDAVKPGRVAGGSPVKTNVESPQVDSFQAGSIGS